MKKTLSLVFALVLLCLLSGCSDQEEKDHFMPDIGDFFASDDQFNSAADEQDDSSAETSAEESAELEDDTKPSYSAILKDLQTTFPEYAKKHFRYELTVERFEVVLSQTEEKTYSASLIAYAFSSYSDYSISLDVLYLKYDQGWVLDSYTWKDYSYKQVRFPEEDKLKNMLYAQGITNVDVSNFTFEEETIKYRDHYSIDWSDYGVGESQTDYTWEYNVNDNAWEYERCDGAGGEFSLGKTWQGIWMYDSTYYSVSDGYIVIRNVTEKSLDLEIQTPYLYNYNVRMGLDEDAMVVTPSEVNVKLELVEELPGSAWVEGDVEMSLTLTRWGDVSLNIIRSGSSYSTSFFYYDLGSVGTFAKISDDYDIMEITAPEVAMVMCVDRFGNPVEGIEVYLYQDYAGNRYPYTRPDDWDANGDTNENGIAFFANTAIDETGFVYLSCPGFAPDYEFEYGLTDVSFFWPSGSRVLVLRVYERGYYYS